MLRGCRLQAPRHSTRWPFAAGLVVALVALAAAAAVSAADADTRPATCSSGLGGDPPVVVAIVDDGVHGLEPWASNPMDGSMAMLTDLRQDGGSDPLLLGTAGRFAYFTADDGVAGRELYATDGTPAGTVRLTDAAGRVLGTTTTTLLGTIGEVGLISMGRVGSGVQVWRSDGTVEGTWLLATMSSGDSHRVRSVGSTDGHVWFADRELVWVSDGTAAGTAAWAGQDLGRAIGPIKERLLFQAWDPDGPTTPGLRASDGTVAGTIDLAPLLSSALVGVAGDKLILAADDGVHGVEPWVTDGTPEGTLLLADTVAEGGAELVPLGDPTGDSRSLAFTVTARDGSRERWVTDGTPAGTRPMGGEPGARPKDRWSAIAGVELGTSRLTIESLGGAQDLASRPDPDARNRLVADGAAGERTRVLGTIPVAPPGFIDQSVGAAGGKGWFIVVEPSDGKRDRPDLSIWVSDGSRRGTHSVLRIHSDDEMFWGDMVAIPTLVTTLAGDALYVADPVGQRLWRTDGTVKETRVVAKGSIPAMATISATVCEAGVDVLEGVAPILLDLDADGPGRPSHLTVLGDEVMFVAKAAGLSTLWRTDGTPAGTVRVADRPELRCRGEFCDYGLMELRTVGTHLAVFARDGLWWSDGTATGTQRVAPGLMGDPSVARRRLYYIGQDDRHGWELWTMAEGERPHLVRDIHPGPADGPCPQTGGDFCVDQIATQAVLGARLIFAADDGRHGLEPWISDGTASGTRMLRDIRPGRAGGGCPSEPGGLPCAMSMIVGARGQVFFWATDRAHGAELWRTDGTIEGTRLVADLRPGTKGSHRNEWFAVTVGPRLFFTADDGDGPALWVSDGTRRGTRRLRTLDGASAEGGFGATVAFHGDLLFVHDDGMHGSELWRSDGTPAGTHLVVDLAPGSASAGIRELAVAGDAAWFAATGSSDPIALWRTDGTDAGTVPVGGIRPDGTPAPDCRRCDRGEPREILAAGGRLYLTADDGIHGRELWVLPAFPGPGERLLPPRPAPEARADEAEAEDNEDDPRPRTAPGRDTRS